MPADVTLIRTYSVVVIILSIFVSIWVSPIASLEYLGIAIYLCEGFRVLELLS